MLIRSDLMDLRFFRLAVVVESFSSSKAKQQVAEPAPVPGEVGDGPWHKKLKGIRFRLSLMNKKEAVEMDTKRWRTNGEEDEKE